MSNAIGNVKEMIANAASRSIATMFPGYFPDWQKHDYNSDFGFPAVVDHIMARRMYDRHSIASAAVDLRVGKVWETHPTLAETDDPKQTPLENEIQKRFAKIRFWQRLMEADRRAHISGYSFLVLRVRDGKPLSEPLETVSGLDNLVELIPAWREQMTVSIWDEDNTSDRYGKAVKYQFKEEQLGMDANKKPPKTVDIHWSRVFVWSPDGTMNCDSLLMSGFNDLITIRKVVGAGGEGFWKNSKGLPVLEVDEKAKVEDMAKAMNTTVAELRAKISEHVEDFSKGFDNMLMLQGIKANATSISLPSPEHFFGTATMCFAASVKTPMKILVGTQTGERASTEDSNQWNKTCASERENSTSPNIFDMIDRLKDIGLLKAKDFVLVWDDLTGASEKEKYERAKTMSDINSKAAKAGEIVFTKDEIREETGHGPATEGDLKDE